MSKQDNTEKGNARRENPQTEEELKQAPQADMQPEDEEVGNEEDKTSQESDKTSETAATTPQEKVQEMGEKLASLNDKYVRLYSEYENYRKRTNLEKAELLLNGGKEVLKAILPVVDDMERALNNIAETNEAKEGVRLIYNKLKTILEQRGVKEIEAKGAKFDENLHEAVSRVPAPDENVKGTILDVVEKGYMLNDKVLRFPKVVVAF